MAKPVSRIIRFLSKGGTVCFGEEPAKGSKEAVVLQGDLYAGLERTGRKEVIDKLLAPVEPNEIFCIGLNYMKHWEESGKKRGVPLPPYPALFYKARSSLNHPGGRIEIATNVDKHADRVDYEVELVIVIGKECKNVPVEAALDYVLGYTVGNDVTNRFWQQNAGGNQWIKGKSFDTFCPMGPVLVTKELIPDPQVLRLYTTVNGETRQDSNTEDMIFSVAQIVSYLSTDMTLYPGTCILTGTPSGVAAGMPVPKWLKHGDTVTCGIEGIGELTNPVVSPEKSRL